MSGTQRSSNRKPESDLPSAEAASASKPASNEGRQEDQDAASGSDRPWANVSRRGFLRRLGLGAVALGAAACGDGGAVPSATPTATTASPLLVNRATATPIWRRYFFPYIYNGPGNVALAVEPTLTPTPPKPTDTPTPQPPTPTPTPVATPFPPGPPSKLGLHVERNVPQIFELLETQAVSAITTLELDGGFAGQIKDISPNTKLIGRLGSLPQVDLSSLDPINAARAFVDQLIPIAEEERRRPHFDGWMAYNEPIANNAEQMARLADFEAERTRLLGERGLRSVIGNFGTGQPPLELWEAFLPAIQAAQQYDGWLGLHEYSAPTIYYLTTRQNQGRYPGVSPEDSGWLTLRYRHVYNEILKPRGLAIPLVFTELGVDGLVLERPGPPDARGWKDFQDFWAETGYGLWGPGAYIEQLVWYDEAMRQDDYVIGGCIYGLGTSAQWLSYDIQGPAAAVLQQYLSVHAPT